MKIEKLWTAMKGACGRTSFALQKNSPRILTGFGVAGSVGAIVLACIATTKLPKVIDEHKAQEEMLKEQVDEIDISKAKTKLVLRTSLKVATLYAPAAALEFASLASIISSHITLEKRNASLAAAYASVHNALKRYRANVIERYGEDIDKELLLGVKQVEETVIDEKTGKEKTVKTKVAEFNPDDPSTYGPYVKVFDDGCHGWTKDPENNLIFLKFQQSYFNDLIRARAKDNGGRGYVFLNEVLDALGIPRTKAGQVVGWIYDETNPVGDNYIDFGIYDIRRTKVRDFINGYERNIILDFNVDGNIWELMH